VQIIYKSSHFFIQARIMSNNQNIVLLVLWMMCMKWMVCSNR